MRELFKWAERKAVGTDGLEHDGMFIVGEKMRAEADKAVVRGAIERVMRVTVPDAFESETTHAIEARTPVIVWTPSMRRMLRLVDECVRHSEPVLLVGETGCGKTTIVQVLAEYYGRRLLTLNCHQHTETADFIGGMRPVSGRETLPRSWTP